MKPKQPNVKNIEWRSPEELHETSIQWVLELKFIKEHPDQLDKLIILSTVGISNIALKEVDVISGESILEKTPEYTSIVTE